MHPTENLEQIAEEEIPIPCGYTYALYSMNTTPDKQFIDYKFAAAVPIMEFMLEEGVKVFTNMHMNWDGIQGVPLFELDWEEGTPLVMKPKCRPIKKNLIVCVVTYYSHRTVQCVSTLLLPRKPHTLLFGSVATMYRSTNSFGMDITQFHSSVVSWTESRGSTSSQILILRMLSTRCASDKYPRQGCR